MGVSFFSKVIEGKRGNDLKLCQRKFTLDIINNFFSERLARHWHRLPKEVMESLPLEVLKKSVYMALKDMG